MIDEIKKEINILSRNLDNRIDKIVNKDIFIQYKNIDILSLCNDDKVNALDCISSMLLLSHAEFETYIEDVARIIFNVSKKMFNENRIINYHCCSLFVWYVFDSFAKKIDKKSDDIKFELLTIQHQSVKKYNELISKNHGITKENIYKLFIPLGFNKNALDEIIADDVISALYKLKNDRGLCGHNSIRIIEYKLSDENQQYIPNYKSKSEEIDTVRRMLEDFANQIIHLVEEYSNNSSKIKL